VDVVRAQKRERLLRIGRRADDRHATGRLEQPLQPLHRQFFIVNDVYAHTVGAPLRYISRSVGTSIRTAVLPLPLSTLSDARSPNSSRSRRSSRSSPCPCGRVAASNPGPSSCTVTRRRSPFAAAW